MTWSGTEARLPARGADPSLAVSVLVLVSERPEPLAELYREYAEVLRESGRSFEFIFSLRPSERHMTEPLMDLLDRGEAISILQSAQPVGDAGLLNMAREKARGRILVTLPAYRRVAASGLPELIERVEQGADYAVARRWPRLGSWLGRLPNLALHLVIRPLTEGRIHDVACGVGAMRRELLAEIPLYGDFFRFLPLLALRAGFRVEEVAIQQHERDAPTRVYNPGIYLRRLLDVFGLFFLLRFTEKPLRFFGLLGSLLFGVGLIILAVVLVQRLGGQGIADRPLLLLGVLLVVLGMQAIALGLVGEIIVHLHAPHRRVYRVASDSLAEDRAPPG